jgi:PleD family two-component response regulator
MGAPRARAGPDVVTGGTRPGGSAAAVLVIEDDQDISLGIRTVLSRNGFEVASSADGKQGLRACRDSSGLQG